MVATSRLYRVSGSNYISTLVYSLTTKELRIPHIYELLISPYREGSLTCVNNIAWSTGGHGLTGSFNCTPSCAF